MQYAACTRREFRQLEPAVRLRLLAREAIVAGGEFIGDRGVGRAQIGRRAAQSRGSLDARSHRGAGADSSVAGETQRLHKIFLERMQHARPKPPPRSKAQSSLLDR